METLKLLLSVGLVIGVTACGTKKDEFVATATQGLDSGEIPGLGQDVDDSSFEVDLAELDVIAQVEKSMAAVDDTLATNETDVVDRPGHPYLCAQLKARISEALSRAEFRKIDEKVKVELWARIIKRLDFVQTKLEHLFKRYHLLPERVQKVVKEKLTIHLKQLYSRLVCFMERFDESEKGQARIIAAVKEILSLIERFLASI